MLINGVDIPLNPVDYITPDLQKALDFYPEYVVKLSLRNEIVNSFQGYLLNICYSLEKANARPNRTRDEYLQRFLQHFGLSTFESYCHEYELPL